MKLLTEYLERAVNLERLAASEADSKFKTELLNQEQPTGRWRQNAPNNTACLLRVRQKFQLKAKRLSLATFTM
jgi:hypothetical protein